MPTTTEIVQNAIDTISAGNPTDQLTLNLVRDLQFALYIFNNGGKLTLIECAVRINELSVRLQEIDVSDPLPRTFELAKLNIEVACAAIALNNENNTSTFDVQEN